MHTTQPITDLIGRSLRRACISSMTLLSMSGLFAKGPILSPKELLNPPAKVIRTCCSFGAEVGMMGVPLLKWTDITSREMIGPHHFLGNKEEGNGIIYTAKGGFIDLGHLRDYADWTAFLYTLIQSEKETHLPYEKMLGHERGQKTLSLYVDNDLDSLLAYDLAGKIAFDLSLWHEISTWFGASYIPLIPERYSSFSPEDLYSNLLGATLGIAALKSDLEFDEAMTFLINETLDSLGAVRSIEETYDAMEDVEGLWWTNESRLPSSKVIKKRYFDSGDELIPWLTSEVIISTAPSPLPWPDESLSKYYEIRIRTKNPNILSKVNLQDPKGSITNDDFRLLIAKIEKDSIDKEAARKKDPR